MKYVEENTSTYFEQDTCDYCGENFLDLFVFQGVFGFVLLCGDHFSEIINHLKEKGL